MSEDRFHLKIDAHGRYEGRGEGIVRVAEQKGRFADRRVADDQQLEHVVEVLVRGLLLKLWILAGHLKTVPHYVNNFYFASFRSYISPIPH